MDPSPEEVEHMMAEKEVLWNAEAVLRLRTSGLTRMEYDYLSELPDCSEVRGSLLPYIDDPYRTKPVQWQQWEWWYFEWVAEDRELYGPGEVVKVTDKLFSVCKGLMNKDRFEKGSTVPLCHCICEAYFMPGGCKHCAVLGSSFDGLPTPKCRECCKCLRCKKFLD